MGSLIFPYFESIRCDAMAFEIGDWVWLIRMGLSFVKAQNVKWKLGMCVIVYERGRERKGESAKMKTSHFSYTNPYVSRLLLMHVSLLRTSPPHPPPGPSPPRLPPFFLSS